MGGPTLQELAGTKDPFRFGPPDPQAQADEVLSAILNLGVNLSPILGDAISLQESKESFDQGKYGQALLGLLGAIPLVGGVSDVAKIAEKGVIDAGKVAGKGLDLSTLARELRATEQGYSPQVYYHGTSQNITPGFDPSKFGASTLAEDAKKGVWLSTNPQTAEEFAETAIWRNPRPEYGNRPVDWEYLDSINKRREEADNIYNQNVLEYQKLRDSNPELASKFFDQALEERSKANRVLSSEEYMYDKAGINIMPLRAKISNPRIVDFAGKEWNDTKVVQEIEKALKEGNDSVHFKNILEGKGSLVSDLKVTDSTIVFDPSRIRSIFAKFDPDKTNSTELLAGLAGLGLINQLGSEEYSR